MKINISPNIDQIRFMALSAMHAWDRQNLEDGRDQVIADMTALLEYLSAFDDAEGVAVASVFRIEAGVRIERSTREGDVFDLTHRYISQNTNARIYGGDCQDSIPLAPEKSVRMDNLVRAVRHPSDLGTRPNRSAKR